MNYHFNLSFTEQDPETLMDTLLQIMSYYRNKDHALNWIRENIRYCPSNVYMLDTKTPDEKKLLSHADEEWLYNLFTFNFIYYPQYNLLAMQGIDIPGIADERKVITIEFQDGENKDYELTNWYDIKTFRTAITNITGLKTRTAMENSDKKYQRHATKKERELRIKVYDTIFNRLKLKDWLEGECVFKTFPDNPYKFFQSFSMCVIRDVKEKNDLWYLLKAEIKEHIN